MQSYDETGSIMMFSVEIYNDNFDRFEFPSVALYIYIYMRVVQKVLRFSHKKCDGKTFCCCNSRALPIKLQKSK